MWSLWSQLLFWKQNSKVRVLLEVFTKDVRYYRHSLYGAASSNRTNNERASPLSGVPSPSVSRPRLASVVSMKTATCRRPRANRRHHHFILEEKKVFELVASCNSFYLYHIIDSKRVPIGVGCIGWRRPTLQGHGHYTTTKGWGPGWDTVSLPLTCSIFQTPASIARVFQAVWAKYCLTQYFNILLKLHQSRNRIYSSSMPLEHLNLP